MPCFAHLCSNDCVCFLHAYGQCWVVSYRRCCVGGSGCMQTIFLDRIILVCQYVP